MKEADFGCGITEADIKNAINCSGYPLQTWISNQLRDEFFIQEEWSFLDDDGSTIRSMDIVAEKYLYDIYGKQPFVRPKLDLIIECKKSELPYVFFNSGGKVWTYNFPVISGLRHEKIIITTDDDPSTWSYNPLNTLGLIEHDYLINPSSHCMTFSKCTRQGKNVVLSGSEPYNSIILPLLKAASHFHCIEKPVETAIYFDCHLVIPIGVLDAPMVAVVQDGDNTTLETIKWTRVYRHQTENIPQQKGSQKTLAVDLVQKNYFKEYIETQVMPFAKEFAEKALKHQKVLTSGQGFVPSMGANWYRNVEPHLTASTIKSAAKRVKAVASRIAKCYEQPLNEGE